MDDFPTAAAPCSQQHRLDPTGERQVAALLSGAGRLTRAALHAAYRFLQTPDVTYEQLIGPHVEQTREAMGQQKRVLLVQDTTEVDYQHHPTTTGLGPIGTGTHHGFLLQTVLAIEPASRQVLGLAQLPGGSSGGF